MMKWLTRHRGLLVVVLWQTAPIGLDEQGRTRISFGFGGGQLEYARTACDGSLIESEGVAYKTAAGSVEHWIGENGRLTVAAGHQWSDSLSANGWYGAARISIELQKFGIGGGVGFIPAVDEDYPSGYEQARVLNAKLQPVPSGYLRVGNKDAVHVRTELFPPSVHTSAEAWRVVVGFNQFDMTKPSGYVGIGAIVTSASEGSTGLVGGFTRPLSSSLAIGGHGFASPGKDTPQIGLTTQLQLTLR